VARPRTSPKPAARSRSRQILPIALLVAVGIAAYWNGLHAPFVWDDETAIVTNRTIRAVLPLSDPLLPPLETPMAGRPIANLSLALNYAIGGLDETGYHWWNLGVLIASALLLFGIVRRTLVESVAIKAAGLSGSLTAVGLPKVVGTTFMNNQGAETVALVSALVWLAHPLLSETVEYVTQRTESMMGLFFLLTLYAAIRARRARESTGWQIVSIASCALGMATKESMVVAPLAVLLYDRVFEFTSIGDALRARPVLYAGLAATWVELGVVMWRWPRSTVGVAAVSPWIYLLNQIQMIVRYVGLAIWPQSLVVDYGLPRWLTIGDVVPQALLLLLMLGGTIVALMRWPAIGFLGVLFFLTLAPTSSVVPIASEVGSERRMYLPLAPLAVLAVSLTWLGLERLRARWPARSRTLAYAGLCVAGAMVAALAVRTMLRNRDYATPMALWESVVARRPHGRARFALASELIAANRHDEATSQLREAVRDYPDARAGLGTELFFQGRTAEAIDVLDPFVRASPANPNRIPARLMLGQALLSQGRLDEGADQFKAVLGLDASSSAANQGLATASRIRAARFLEQGNSVQALVPAREATRLGPGDAEAHNLLGVALASQGQYAEAAQEFQLTLRLNPKHPSASNNLERALAMARRGQAPNTIR
jgi:Flp pilus assembly protein TadD